MNIRKSSFINHKSGQPIQYHQGWTEFYKLKFKVTPDVLIPRPETELLVDEVLAYAEQSKHPEERNSDEGSGIVVLDIGTGSGNIAIAIAKNAPNVKIIATDISDKALSVASQNAKLHGVEDQIQFVRSDLLENPTMHNTKSVIQIIVTNLPYIPTERISYLDSSVKDFEPHLALDGGQDGFELYRKLFAQIQEKGWKPELVLGEIDYTHADIAYLESQKYFPDYQVEVKKDLAHLQRILIITKAKRRT